MTGDLDLNSNKIVNLANGTIATDAVNLSQLTSEIAALGTMASQNANNVAITGGTINGTSIGATTRAAGNFTTLNANSTLAVTGVATFSADSAFNSTGALKIPAGTTAQQPTPTTGMIRYNSTNASFEGYYASAWSSLGSAAGSNTQVQYNNSGVLAGSSALTFNGTTLATTTLQSTNLTNGSFTTSTLNAVLGSAKAWVLYNGVAQTVTSSYNVSSVTYNSAGVYTINFINAFASADYIMAGSAASNGNLPASIGMSVLATTSCEIRLSQHNTGPVDRTFTCATFFNT
jgi:hypothetical protein